MSPSLSSFFKSKLKLNPSAGAGTRTALSVNSLAKISSNLDTIASGEAIRKAALLSSIVLCSFFIADLLALLFEKYIPSPPVSMLANRQRAGAFVSPAEYETIINRNLFSSKEPSKKGNDIDMDADPVPTTLPFQLIGTVIFVDPNKSMAAILDKGDTKTYPVRIGDEIEGKAQILSVEARRVVFINPMARRKEMVELPEDTTSKISFNTAPKPSAGIATAGENNYVVTRAEINSQLANWNTLITQALAVPEMQGGQMMGFRLRQVQPGSFYEKIGIKQNDLIHSVNGEKLTDVAKAASLLNDLKTMSSLTLSINRDGKEVSLNYDIR